MSNKTSYAKQHLIVGKLYSNACIYCMMMSEEWDKMISNIVKDMKLKLETDKHDHLSRYAKYISKDGSKVVEIIEVESTNMENEADYINNNYLKHGELDTHGGVPTLFRINNGDLSYYNNGNRTAGEMGKFYYEKKNKVMKTRRKYRKNKTKKNITRSKYFRL
jgi:hypothetical protein